MSIRTSALLFFLFTSFLLKAQSPLTPGFTMLETGKFNDAKAFFEHYLESDGQNPTALLCYGRALGLSGNPTKALEVFGDLKKKSPDSYEVALNIAEAYMWSKDYSIAKSHYEELVKRDSTSFSANLGLANANSELKDYDSALKYIGKALEIQPTNGNALTSQKFMFLGKSAVMMGIGRRDQSEILLKKILENNPEDEDGMINLATLYSIMGKYKEALGFYERLLKSESKKVDAAIGTAQVKNKQKKNKEALEWMQKAIDMSDSTSAFKAQMGYVDALGWNKRFKEAFQKISELEQTFPKEKEGTLAARGRLGIWSKGFKVGAGYYLKLLEISPKSFEGNLGYADANHAMGMDNKSFEYVRKTLGYYPGQIDASQFLDRLYMGHDPNFTPKVYFSRDNGGNASQNISLKGSLDPSPLINTFVQYYQREVYNINQERNDQNSLVVKQITVGASKRQNGILKYGGALSLIQAPQGSSLVTDVNTEWKAGKYQIIELNYRGELQTFNADLINQNLKQKNFNLNYNLFLPSKIGLYSQIIRTQISDGNNRNLIFASLYYLAFEAPVFKLGVNYGGFGFKNQVPQLYFSPDKFRNYELFVAAENLGKPKTKFIYQATFAKGLQKISSEKYQGIYRFDIKCGLKFTPRLHALAYFLKSNSAASSVQGFTYNEWGINAGWIINKHTF
ncbi:tetratricopeptide repeat protein [Lacihabitans lacunae]|uniref:Tetratricopeptide repeat protein n=1 Tax=Lacihabitans lacunae TaxID=1028214 RepID=A0ABV7YWZ0_9BACT